MFDLLVEPDDFSFFSEEAGNILGIAENVLQALDGAKVAQDDAELAINNANKDIEDADLYLTQVCSFHVKHPVNEVFWAKFFSLHLLSRPMSRK